jgi:large subunit ribosomal protein L4
MKATIYNLKGESAGEMTLPKSVFGLEVDSQFIATGLRIYQSNIRSSHAKVKDRGEVAGTTKKMWAQKGTGHARHGSAKAPLFVGGGVAHGPQGNQTYKLKINKKAKKVFVAQILSKFAENKCIIVVDQFKDLAPKTKEAWGLIDKIEKDNKVIASSKKIAVITSNGLTNVKRAFGNIPGFKLITLGSLNPLHLSNQNFLIFSKKAVMDLAKRYE